LAADLEQTKILAPFAMGYLRPGFDPKAKLIQIRQANRTVVHPVNQMLTHAGGKIIQLLMRGISRRRPYVPTDRPVV
jgi:hypothetical protein